MSRFRSAIYRGRVVHQRLVPARHRLAYRVFALSLDLDEIDELARELPLFSRNRFNLLGFHDRDHGAGDGRPIAEHMRGVLTEAGLAAATARIRLICYPRILGYVFNPLSVYVCEDTDGRPGAIVYEVSNTFGERHSYIIPVEHAPGGIVSQSCAKQLYVSPFTSDTGRYSFRVRAPGDDLLVAVAFRDATGPVLNTHFTGTRQELTAGALAGLLAAYPLMTLKVIAGIHVEAARIWMKGVAVVPHRAAPRYASTLVQPIEAEAVHA